MNLSEFLHIKKGEYTYEVETSDVSKNFLIKKEMIESIEYTDNYITLKLISGKTIKLRVNQDQFFSIFNQLDMPELLI